MKRMTESEAQAFLGELPASAVRGRIVQAYRPHVRVELALEDGSTLDGYGDSVEEACLDALTRCRVCDGSGRAICDACSGSGDAVGGECRACRGAGEVRCGC